MIKISELVANLPHSMLLIPHMPDASLLLITFGGLWLCLWQQIWQVLGTLPIMLGLVGMWMSAFPDMIIDDQGKIAAQNQDGKLVFYGKPPSLYTREQWLKYFGQKEMIIMPQQYHWQQNSYRVKLVLNSELDCQDAEIIIAPQLDDSCGQQVVVIDRGSLARGGTHLLWLDEGGVKIKRAQDKCGRPWDQAVKE